MVVTLHLLGVSALDLFRFVGRDMAIAALAAFVVALAIPVVFPFVAASGALIKVLPLHLEFIVVGLVVFPILTLLNVVHGLIL